VTTFNVAVNGDTTDILDFIHTLVTSEHFTNAAVQALSLSISEPNSEGEERPLRQKPLSESIYMRIPGSDYGQDSCHALCHR